MKINCFYARFFNETEVFLRGTVILSRFLKVTKEQLTHLTALEGQKLSFTPTASLDTSKDSVQDCALSDSVNEV